MMRDGLTNMRILTVISYDHSQSWHFTLERKCYYGSRSQARTSPNYMGTNEHRMNYRCPILLLSQNEKTELLEYCKENNVKCYKSWNKSKIIGALLNC